MKSMSYSQSCSFWGVSKKKKIRQREKSCQSPHGGRGNGTAEQSMETETTAAVVYNGKKVNFPLRSEI